MDRLFICHMPSGLAYCDRGREVNGDYARIAFLYWGDLSSQPAKGADGLLLAAAREHAASYQARRGEFERVSSCGQTIELGWMLPNP